jgi:hypothetical protein
MVPNRRHVLKEPGPGTLADALVLAYPTKRHQSAWIGIAVNSTQSVFLAATVLTLVI